MARLAVLLPYSSSGPSRSSSRQLSPAIGPTSFQRRGSLSGLLSPRALSTILPSTTSSLLLRRRTIFTDSPFGSMSSLTRAWISTPEELVEALDAVADFSIQSNLHPLPASRPLIVLVPIMTDPPPKVMVGPSTTTPSAVCFPATSSPSSPTSSISAALDRALAFLRRAKREIEDIESDDGSQVVLMGYSTNPDLPSHISSAAKDEGAKCILTPPFTPNSLIESFSESLNVSTESLLVSSSSTVLLPQYVPFIPSPSPAGSTSFMSSLGSKISSLSSWSFQKPTPVYYVDKPLPPKPLPPLPPDAGSRGSVEYSRASFSKYLPPPLSLNQRFTRPVSPPLPALPPEASSSDLTLPLTPEQESPPLLGDIKSRKYSDPIADYLNVGRRRSVDTGGLALALANANDEDWISPRARGTGWGGWEDTGDIEGPLYAELLGDMYMQTQMTTTVDLPTDSSSSAFLRSPLRQELIQSLSSWKFEPHLRTHDELLGCTYLLFEALFRVEGMEQDCAVTSAQLLPFLFALRSIYHAQNKYHNFQHAVDVHQAIYSFLVEAGCAPPVTILLEDNGRLWKRQRTGRVGKIMENRDLFAICIAAVGHDVGHPGLSNAFMKNARTPLSVVYDDKSVLEQMHCALLLQLMRKHNLGHLISTPPSPHSSPISPEAALEFRRLLVQTVLITDMSLHFEWIGRFENLAKYFNSSDEECLKELVPVDGGKLLLCQALIKCGDISNPTRPHAVSEHWSTALLEEWSYQASLEQELGLPISVVSTTDRIVQAKGQIGFINLFTKPLFSATASAIPELEFFANQCHVNLALWQNRLDALEAVVAVQENVTPTSSTPPNEPPQSPHSPAHSIPRTLSPPLELHYRSVFPLSIPASLLTPLPSPSPISPWLSSMANHLESHEKEHESDREDDSATPTIPLRGSEPRLKRVSSSIHSASSSIASPSPFSPVGGLGDTTSTAASSPLSHPRSLTCGENPLTFMTPNGHPPMVSGDVSYPTATRAAYHNATVKKKKSFHRISWDVSRTSGGKFDAPPVPPTPSPLRVESANPQRTP